MARTLKVYTAQTKISLWAQSQVVEEALREFFEKRSLNIWVLSEPKESDDSTEQQSFSRYKDISFEE